VGGLQAVAVAVEAYGQEPVVEEADVAVGVGADLYGRGFVLGALLLLE
jgi:hypothetical protein